MEIVLGVIEAFSRGELEAMTRHTVPDVEVDWSRSSGVEAGIYRGQDATLRFWQTFFEAFDRLVITPEEVIPHGDTVLVFDRTRRWGRDGIEVESRNATVFTLRGELIAGVAMYPDRAEALKAVGLEQ